MLSLAEVKIERETILTSPREDGFQRSLFFILAVLRVCRSERADCKLPAWKTWGRGKKEPF
jgi:hypothetical protein